MSIDKFSAKCKAEAVPDLVNLLSLDEIGSPHIPIRIDVNGSKWGRRLGDADVEVLVSAIFASGLPVAALTLSNHDITDVGVTTLCKLLNDEPAEGFKSATTILELRGNEITSKGCEYLAAALASNKILRVLDLSWNPIGMRGGFRLAEMLVSNVGIEVLRVGNVDFTTDTLIALLSLLRTNEVIVEFDCQNPRLFSRQEDTTKHVARVLELNRTLRALNLGKCAVGDDGAALLADALRFNGALCSLSLACNSIGAMGAEALATLILEGACPTLSELNLLANSIGDDGAAAFADAIAAQPAALRKLDLRSNNISDEGLYKLALAVGNAELQRLLLWGNDFGRSSAVEFDALLNGKFKYMEVACDLASYTTDGVIYIASADMPAST